MPNADYSTLVVQQRACSSRRGVMYHSAKIDSGVRYPPYSQHTFERKIVSRLTP